MRKLFYALGLLVLSLGTPAEAAKHPELTYRVDLNDRADDLFKVTLNVKGLKSDNNIFQFAATAPGTYQTMDIGRFVRGFKAYDKKGREIATKQVSTNQWELTTPKKVRRISYQIAETWDTPVDKNKVYNMCGTSLEQDHALINGQGVFGYLKGLQGSPMRLKLDHPQNWTVGTAMATDKDGYYLIKNYDYVVDSPIMAGSTLTKAETTYDGTQIDLYTYSKTGKIKSQDLLSNMTSMLNAVHKFVVKFPVDRYTFLFHFEDQDWGAWEHSYSSEYVMKEQDFTPKFAHNITDIASHEFFHIITPLNIHSEIIEQFNFVTPTPSQHLWLYEGTTEWASDIMQLRAGMITLEEYLKDMQQKLYFNDQLGNHYSLQELSLTSYTPEGNKIYGNIYHRGAATAAMLDIRLLELSGGKRGLREVINELSKEYGPSKAFPESEFFSIFTAKTYPEIADFFNRYVKGNEPLPLADYFGIMGIRYIASQKSDKQVKDLGYQIVAPNGVLTLIKVNEAQQKAGLAEGDEMVSVNGTEITLANANAELGRVFQMPAGETYTMVVKRKGKSETVKLQMLEKQEEKRHIFEVDPEASPEKLAFRKSWMTNL
ncbi:MAG TPA: hypothetical protein VGD90_13660 [Sphingobacteriaceae bacterium]